MIEEKPCIQIVAKVDFEFSSILKNGKKLIGSAIFFVLLDFFSFDSRFPIDQILRYRKKRANSTYDLIIQILPWLLALSCARKVMNAKAPVIKIDSQRVFFDVSVVNTEAICKGAPRPFPYIFIIFSDPIF